MDQSLDALMETLKASTQPHKGPLTVADLHHHQQRVHAAMMQTILVYWGHRSR